MYRFHKFMNKNDFGDVSKGHRFGIENNLNSFWSHCSRIAEKVMREIACFKAFLNNSSKGT